MLNIKNFIQKMKKTSLFSKIVSINICILCITLIFIYTLNLINNLKRMEKNLTINIQSLSYTLATNKEVKEALVDEKCSDTMISYLDNVTSHNDYINIITIANNDSIRIYHSIHNRIGEQFYGGDEDQFSDTQKSYVTTGEGTLGKQLRAFTQVFDDEGNSLGFVMVSVLYSYIDQIRIDIIKENIFTALIALLLTVFASFIIASLVKKSLFGYEPTSFAHRYLQRNEVINGLNEGILAIDKEGQIIVCNEVAARLVGSTCSAVEGNLITKILPETGLLHTLQTGIEENHVEMKINGHEILTSRIPLLENGKVIGVTSIFEEVTQAQKLAEELTGVNVIVDVLRSNMHEFKNNMHIILGLLQLGETNLAMNYITQFNSSQACMSNVLKQIENKTLAAMIFGKINIAREAGALLSLDENSYLPAHNPYLTTYQLTTILGNLLENAIDAVKITVNEQKEIHLFICCDEQQLKIIVDDNGIGMNEDTQTSIFTKGFSTKGENRGIGLPLIQKIIMSVDGLLTIDSTLNEGTIFTIIINKKKEKTND